MQRLSLIVAVFVVAFGIVFSLSFNKLKSPHGETLKISCAECHTTNEWKMDSNSTFDHNSTEFMLRGQHKFTKCLACHPTLIFKDAANNCNECHTDMHQQTVGFDCDRCHTAETWLIPNINSIHNQSRFPLTGSHITADCNSCHFSSNNLQFTPIGIECYDCHKAEFASTTKPNHVTAHFSTDCINCHNASGFSWSGSGFSHNNYFPIYSGRHAGEWNDCADCHTNSSNYADFSCINCHEHSQQNTDDDHDDVSGYSYNSQACLKCHPRGTE